MSIENEIKIMKDNYPKSIIFVKIGAFYHTYLKDAYIISYLFGYQLKKSQNINNCGFTATIFDNVIKKMEVEKISYIISNNKFEIEGQQNFGDENKYDEVFENAYKYLLKRNKIEEINRYLMENIGNNNIMKEINEIEQIIYKF
ncbi:MAG: hypothetical protein OSJ66_00030 [Clostridia bacterium]|nr:hypothetical protein [Clostridia bacterium]